MGRIFRVLCGFLLACLAAGLTKVLFAFTPSELSSLPSEIMVDRLQLAVPIATHTAIFSTPWAIIPLFLAEWQRWRDWAYYAAVGIAIALLGFAIQLNNETAGAGWSVMDNNYPLLAFLTTGFVGGLVYWLFSGRLAGHHILSAHGRHGLGGGHHNDNGRKPGTTTTVNTTGGRRT